MTNKLTKKGLAFATAFAFVASALVGVVPAANASASGPVSLLPASGSSYESIRQSGFTFKSQFDVSEFQSGNSLDEDQTPAAFWFNRTSSAQALIYKVESVNGENLRTSYFDAPDATAARASSVPYFEAMVGPSGNFTGGTALLEAVAGYASTGGNTNNIAYIAVYRDADTSGNADGGSNSDQEDGVAGNWYGEWNNIVATGNDVVVARITAPDATANISLKVTAFLDENYDTVLTFGEQASAEETITLYSDDNVTTGTATITSTLSTGTQNVLVETALVPATINPYMVATGSWAATDGHIATRLYKDGNAFSGTYTTANVSAAASTVSSVDKLITTFSSVAVTQGTYTARSFLVGGSSNAFGSWVTGLGAASGVIQGTNAEVLGAYGKMTQSTSILKTADGYDIKSGTKALTVTAQIVKVDGSDALEVLDDLAAPGVRVRLTATRDVLATASEVTVTGSATKLTKTANTPIVVYGNTDAKGQVTFTINNSGALNLDDVNLVFSARKLDGSWSNISGATLPQETLDVVWDDVQIAEFSTDAEALSGANISITYDVLDQFGGPISNDYDASEDESKSLSVTVLAWDSDTNSAADKKLLNETKIVSGGKATFTFANFANLGGHSDVRAYLHRTTDEETVDIENEYTENANTPIDVRIYKNDATSGIVSEPTFSTQVSLAKFYSGNLDEDAALFDAASEDGVLSEDAGSNTDIDSNEDYAVISGTVETTGEYGAAAQQVTISGSGLQFRFDGNYLNAFVPTSVTTPYVYGYDDILSQNSATFFTDVDGTFTVYVYAHMVNTAGQTVTITSGGKSTTVLLKTFLNDGMFADLDFQKFTWNFPKYPGLGVQVATAKLTDKWSNVVPNMELRFDANEDINEDDDFVFIDGQGSDSVYKYTNEEGEATVRIRTFSQGRLAAPGDVDIELEGGGFTYGYNYDYDWNNDGDLLDGNEWSYDVEGSSSSATIRWSGFFGAQATARVGKNAGVVNVSVFNADGRKVTVKVGNKTITTNADGRVEKIRVKGVNSGSRTVTVKIGKKVALTKFVSVK